MTHPRQIILAVLFLGLLIGPAAYFRWNADSDVHAHSSPGERENLFERYGFVLQESAAQAGIDFLHHPPKIDSRLDHIAPQIAAMGASVAVVDFDRDGWQDFYLTDSAPGSSNRLYRNQQNGTFQDVAAEMGLADLNRSGTGACMGSVWADINNDGFEDVLVYKWGRVELFRNQQGKTFERITEAAGLPDWANIGSATWLDYDRDGLIDLFLAGYWPESVHLEKLDHTRIMPESFEYANNGGRKWLLRNNGNGTFHDVTADVGIDSTRWTLAVIAADFNDDAFPDLFLANDYGVSEFYLNQDGNGFSEIGKQTGIGHAPKSGMNAAVGDVLNRGRLAIYESNISEEGVLLQGNNLWFPAAGDSLRFDNLASVMGIELAGWSFGAQFGDLNNDGFIDLYVTNGYVSGDRGTSYWYDFSQITGGHQHIISDTQNWPEMKGRSLAGYQSKRLWLNDGAGQFQDVAQFVGATDRLDGRAVALADFNNQGDLDLVVANQRGPLLLYQNEVQPQRHWIAFELQGTHSNRSAIGAQIRVDWGGQQQLQELVAASGYSAQNQRRLHFGLGDASRVERVSIRWPSGKKQLIENPSVNQTHQIQEPE
ncbi:CRTAC1 family protein [Stieleria sp. TO1_6]|uniref:CRTAC1 family protein n=1 Tax=Stieleria tagensis TaxID=2956795 RepID=UPI00209B28B6|nr:CRTAC1 family protein [Stieleria tagensis]MCO8123863.1 CRTAC1 family protein [Stieleria tagensis]